MNAKEATHVLGYTTLTMIDAFKETRYLGWLGIFVVADALIIGPFWVILAAIAWYLESWHIFFLGVALFWVVRGLGETMYWIHEQFATTHRNDPKNLFGYRLVKSEAIWFLYQIFWQCVTVLALLATVLIIW